jgi:pyruvate/2-oxoacid:ferredoxin oxidoreductase beta subunit
MPRKDFDYLNLSGITRFTEEFHNFSWNEGWNPNLKIIGFFGDGDAYAEGMEHTIQQRDSMLIGLI